MPEFILEGRDHAARAESQFVLGFIEAMFFTESSPAYTSHEWFGEECQEAIDAGNADGTLPGDVGYCDIHPDSLAAIRADCAAWQEANAAILQAAYDCPDYDEAQAGRDYWFTRNGHGLGFWDRKQLAPGGIGESLTRACEYREVDVFFGNHVAYGDAHFVHVEL